MKYVATTHTLWNISLLYIHKMNKPQKFFATKESARFETRP